MSIDAIPTTPPAIAQLEQQFADLTPQPSSTLPAPTDPFEVLLGAASSQSTDASAATSSVLSATTTAVAPQLVSLASSSGSSAPTPSSTTPTTSSGSAIVAQASQYLGVPYVWGGSTPSGFDCSGLTQYVFGQLDVELPRTAAEQEQVGTPVASLAKAQPGDLLFFEPGQNGAPLGQAGHVAIYIGNDQMIAAPETGENVQIQQVPGQPLAIRQVTVPTSPVTTSTSTSASDPIANGTDSDQMGNVSVPVQYANLIEQASNESGTPAPLLAAIVDQESGFDPTAVSSAGAEGIAQFMPATATANGVDPLDPASAIEGAGNLLAQYHTAFGSWSDAIAAYNAGGAAVVKSDGIPQNGSTPSYVADVLSLSGMDTAS